MIPNDMPLFLRISATDWLEEAPKDQIPESWKADDTIRLAKLLAEKGVDLLDVSTGGNHPLQHPHVKPAYRKSPYHCAKLDWETPLIEPLESPFAIKIKSALGSSSKMAVGSVGGIDNAQLANDLLEKDGLDLITVGRGFQKNPGLVFAWADELGQQVQMPNQIRWGFKGRGSKPTKAISEFPELMGDARL